jgi:hypothetical protein
MRAQKKVEAVSGRDDEMEAFVGKEPDESEDYKARRKKMRQRTKGMLFMRAGVSIVPLLVLLDDAERAPLCACCVEWTQIIARERLCFVCLRWFTQS